MAAKKKTTTEKEPSAPLSIARKTSVRTLRMTPEALKERVKVLSEPAYYRVSNNFLKNMATAVGKERLLTFLKKGLDLNEVLTVNQISGPLNEGFAKVVVDYGLCDMKVIVKRELYFSLA